MQLPFKKYQGTGNDFVLIDAMDEGTSLEKASIPEICDRHFGIGADGVIVLEGAKEEDLYMRFHNPDGSESFCGNGSRCAVKAYCDRYGRKGEELRFGAVDGLHTGKLLDDGRVEVSIGNVKEVEEKGDHAFVHTGSPHVIRPVEDPDEVDLKAEAHYFRDHPVYNEKGGTNVNLVQVQGKGRIRMRTFERGVEAETLSCGSGVVAAALWAADMEHAKGSCQVSTEGGELEVHFQKKGSAFQQIRLIGPAEHVFDGEWVLR